MDNKENNEQNVENKWYKQTWAKIVGVVAIVVVLVLAFASPTDETVTEEVTETEEVVTEEVLEEAVEDTKEAEDISVEGSVFTTSPNGIYMVGLAPALYSTGGEEVEIPAGQSYTVGTDIVSDTYDIEVVSGEGSFTSEFFDLTVDMNDGENNHYDNMLLSDGDVITTTGITIKLVPQSNDFEYLEEGTYDIVGTGKADAGVYVITDSTGSNVISEGFVFENSIEEGVEIPAGSMIVTQGASLDFIPAD